MGFGREGIRRVAGRTVKLTHYPMIAPRPAWCGAARG